MHAHTHIHKYKHINLIIVFSLFLTIFKPPMFKQISKHVHKYTINHIDVSIENKIFLNIHVCNISILYL